MSNVLVCDGDSITTGFGTTTSGYPSFLRSSNWSIHNVAVNSETLATMATNASTTVDSLYSSGNLNCVIIWGGTNDFAIDGSTVSSVYSTLKSYCASRRAVGWTVIVTTMISRSGTNPTGGESLDKDHDDYNSLIRANWQTFADGLADVAGNADLGADGASNNTAFFQSGGIHPVYLGITAIEVPIFISALNTLFGSGVFSMAQAFVQGNSTNFISATSVSTAFVSGNTAGNLLAAVGGFVNTSTPSITDTAGNIWTNIYVDSTTVSGQTQVAYYCLNSKGGANTVTLHQSGSAALIGLAISEYSGVNALDQFQKTTGNGTTATTPSFSNANAAEILIAFFFSAGGITSFTAPYTQRESILSGGTTFISLGDNVVSSIGTQQASATVSSGIWGATLAAFKEFSASTGSTSDLAINSLQSIQQLNF